jgi:catechol 2,3-dioxygenase-like lactoylglutathione lyase family enzyme
MSTETIAGATEFAHMLLKVSDIKRSERFYVDLLGFKLRQAKPLPDGRPFVPFLQGLALTSGGPEKSPQIDHIAFKAKGVPEIAKRLKAANVKFDRDVHNGLYGLTIYIYDPDGNMIELYDEDAKMA